MTKSNEQLTLDIDWGTRSQSLRPTASEADVEDMSDEIEEVRKGSEARALSGSMLRAPRVGYDSSLPTERAPEAMALARMEPTESSLVWDDESPTSVVIDRPLLPRPPRPPSW